MKKFTLVILLFAVAFSTFAKSGKCRWWQRKCNTIISVGLHRTVCYGHCPDYTIDVNKNGTVTYTAIRFTPDTGIFTKDIGKEKAAEIIDMFTKYQVDTCAEMYENRIPDLPGLNIFIKYKKSKKTIYSAAWGPHFLTEIAEVLDETGKKTDDSWKKIGMPKLEQ